MTLPNQPAYAQLQASHAGLGADMSVLMWEASGCACLIPAEARSSLKTPKPLSGPKAGWLTDLRSQAACMSRAVEIILRARKLFA